MGANKCWWSRIDECVLRHLSASASLIPSVSLVKFSTTFYITAARLLPYSRILLTEPFHVVEQLLARLIFPPDHVLPDLDYPDYIAHHTAFSRMYPRAKLDVCVFGTPTLLAGLLSVEHDSAFKPDGRRKPPPPGYYYTRLNKKLTDQDAFKYVVRIRCPPPPLPFSRSPPSVHLAAAHPEVGPLLMAAMVDMTREHLPKDPELVDKDPDLKDIILIVSLDPDDVVATHNYDAKLALLKACGFVRLPSSAPPPIILSASHCLVDSAHATWRPARGLGSLWHAPQDAVRREC